MYIFDDVAIAIKEGVKESVKHFSKLGTELSKLAIKEPDKISKLFENGTDKPKIAENNEINFPWEKRPKGFLSGYTPEAQAYREYSSREALKAERHPAKLPSDICKRLVNEGDLFSEELWSNVSLEGRCAILNEAFRIMAEEACIPEELIENAVIEPYDFQDKPGTHTNAAVNFFIDTDETGKFHVVDDITIAFNQFDLMNPAYSLKDSLASLYHEVLHAMQEQSLCEGGNTFTYREMQKEWAENIKNRLDLIKRENAGEKIELNKSFTEYLTEPMETWAHMQSDYFTKILDATRIENLKEQGYRFAANTKLTGFESASTDISFGSRSWESKYESAKAEFERWSNKYDARSARLRTNPTDPIAKSELASAKKQMENAKRNMDFYKSRS